MNADFIGRENASFNCSGQWNYEMQIPEYLNPKPKYHPQMNFFYGHMTECTPTSSYMDTCWDLLDDDLDCFYEDYPASLNDEFFNIDELTMMERLMQQQLEINRRRLTRQLKLQYAEDDRTFLKQLLSEEENRWDSRWMNISHTPVQLFDEDVEKESWGQSSSMEQFSEQGSSEKISTHSDSSNTVQQQEPKQKSRHCRHFLKGHCERGDSCGFRHDHSVFCTDLQKVFLVGLPAHLTASLLIQKLAEQGYTVLNHPKILRWFSPQVCLGSVEEAQSLIEKGTIVIDGAVIRVRPFEAFTRGNKKKLPDEVERSVFLGGLAAGTTAEMIKDELGNLGLVVVNIPMVKSGYSRQVALKTYQQAQTLLKLMRVQINGALVNVRPFANIRSSSDKRKKRKNM